MTNDPSNICAWELIIKGSRTVHASIEDVMSYQRMNGTGTMRAIFC